MIASRLTSCCKDNGRRALVPGARRAGYTLLEIVMVVALLVVLTGLTLPSIDALFADGRLEAAGDMIRARMADARSMAMEQGKPFRFGYVPGSGKFQIAADDSSLWNSVSDVGTVDSDDQVAGELPQGILFGTDSGSISGGHPSSSGSWQVGGVFLPDGTARGDNNADGTSNDDATFYYGNAGFSPMAVRLRGLTGIVRVFDPTAPEGDHP